MRKSTPLLVAIALIFGTMACSDNPFEPGTPDVQRVKEDPIQFPVERPLADNGELKEVDEDEI